MSVGTAAAIAIGGGLMAGGGVASSLIGKSAASKASTQQVNAAGQAIDETNRVSQQAQDIQNKQLDTATQNLAPWMTAGTGALGLLSQGTQPGGSLVTPFGETYQTPEAFKYDAFDPGAAFTAPTLDNTNDPGYAFRLREGTQALARGAAASGGAFSGGTLSALARYGQDYASNEYGNVYNRALNTYQTNFNDRLNAYGTNFANAYNTYNTNVNTGLNAYNTRFNAYNTGQTNNFNRLAALAGMGQNATNLLTTTGANTANTLAQILQNQGINISNLLTGQGQARAAGTLGQAQALNTGLNSVIGAIPGLMGYGQNASLIKLLSGGSYGGAAGAEGPVLNQLPTNYGADYQAGDD